VLMMPIRRYTAGGPWQTEPKHGHGNYSADSNPSWLETPLHKNSHLSNTHHYQLSDASCTVAHHISLHVGWHARSSSRSGLNRRRTECSCLRPGEPPRNGSYAVPGTFWLSIFGSMKARHLNGKRSYQSPVRRRDANVQRRRPRSTRSPMSNLIVSKQTTCESLETLSRLAG
jgi:hypothetical protein